MKAQNMENLADIDDDTLPKLQRRFMRKGTRLTRGQLRSFVLDAVRVLLRNSSYEKMSMEQVAATASISRRTLYNLFEDKDELYHSCCERVLCVVRDKIAPEIPERMAPDDGMRFFISNCQEVYGSEAAIDLMLAVVRDGTCQSWLVDAYHRDINHRLVQICENFVLKKSRHKPMKPTMPRHISEQLVGVVKSLTVGPYIFGRADQTGKVAGDRLEILASAYSAMIWDSRIG